MAGGGSDTRGGGRLGGPRSPHGLRVPGDTRLRWSPAAGRLLFQEGWRVQKSGGIPPPGQCWMDHLEPNPHTPADRALG